MKPDQAINFSVEIPIASSGSFCLNIDGTIWPHSQWRIYTARALLDMNMGGKETPEIQGHIFSWYKNSIHPLTPEGRIKLKPMENMIRKFLILKEKKAA